MSGKPSAGRSDLAKVVEKQMRMWELARSQQPVPEPSEVTSEPASEVADFITISRTLASGGSRVAVLLGERLGWPVYDRELLQAMAEDDHIRTRMFENLDERETNWLEETVRWIVRGEFQREDYFYRLSETVLAVARRQRAVFLGRAADLILPRERGLRVRITASPTRCAREYAQRTGISDALAQAEVERVNAERADFRKRHFGKSADAPGSYDLGVCLDHFTPEQAVELILQGVKLRGLGGV